MWTRFKRLLRSIFGGIISDAEDPELILQQLLRDMRDEVPKLQNNVAMIMANEKRLNADIEKNQNQVVQLDNKIKAAIRTGNDDIATTLIAQMQTAQRGLETTKQLHEQAKVASVKAREHLDNYMLQFERKKAEAMQLIASNRQAQMQERVAQTMASFQVGDNSQTFDDMREKIANRVASAEAKAELASSGLDSRMQTIERSMADIEAQDMLSAYKQQLGLAPAQSSNVLGEGAPVVNVEKTLGAADAASQERRKLAE
jgi:phage shock protein A